MRGQFAVLSLKWNCYLAVRSINLHETYLNTQLGSIYNDINIIIKIERKTCDIAEYIQKLHFPLLCFEHRYLPYYNILTLKFVDI